METSSKNKWLDQINQLFETGSYLRALDVIAEATKEFPGDQELEQLETLAWGGLGKNPGVGRLVSKVGREAVEGPYEPSLGTKTLLNLIEDRRRDRAVDACLYQARWLKSQNDVAGALRALDGGLHRFPHEARLVQLRDLFYVASKPIKPQDPGPFEAGSPETNVRTADVTPHGDEFQKLVAPVAAAVGSSPPKPAPVERPRDAKPVGSKAATRLEILAVVGTAVAILSILGAVRFIVEPKPSAVVVQPTPQQAVLEITTLPPGAVVLVDGKHTDTSALLLGVPLAAGPVQIEARLPGFQTARTTANLHTGVRSPVTLTLTPILTFQLLLPGNGEISISNEEPVKVEDGTFSRELTPGTYAVKIKTDGNGLLSFAFPVDSGGAAVLTSLPTASNLSALLISNFGEQGRIYTTGPPVKIKLNGQALGELSRAGLDLPKVAAGSHELELGENQALRKTWAEFGTSRTLTAIINPDPNTGTLVVQANQNDAAITVLAGRTEIARRQTKHGRLRLPNLRAQRYVVRAAKDGYDVDPSERSVDIQNGQDKIIAFTFRRKPQMGSVRIRVTAGSELLADGKTIGTVAGETYTITDLKPGTHTFRAQKGKQSLPNQKSLEIVAGQNGDIDLQLVAPSIPVEIRQVPADATVTFGIAEWGKAGWTQNRGWYSRKGGGIVYFPKPLGTGSVEFAIHWQGQGSAQWIVNGSDNSYLQCELDDEGFQVFRVTTGWAPVPVSKKKPVAKMASYTIWIEVKPDGVTHKLQRDGAWETLDSLQETAPASGKFGFNIPNRQELFLANLIFEPDRGRAARGALGPLAGSPPSIATGDGPDTGSTPTSVAQKPLRFR
jgi:hypothetical protein